MPEARRRADPATQNGHWEKGGLGSSNGRDIARPSPHCSGSDAAPVIPARTDGFIGGGQLGYNWQFGRTVLGVEASLSGSDLQDTLLENPLPGGNDYRTNSKINYLASLTGRVGVCLRQDPGLRKGRNSVHHHRI